jgi:hemolysin III
MNWLIPREPVNAWTHGAWALGAIPATLLLWKLCGGDRVKQATLLIFGASLLICFGASTLYHGVRLPADDIEICRQIDHIGIYILIGGTVTPAAAVLLIGWWRVIALTIAWGMAAAGISIQLTWPVAPDWFSTTIYVVMGWGVCLSYFEMSRALPRGGMRSTWLGGLFYTVGAMMNLVGWPRLVPGVFSTHELWHVFCIAGSSCHLWFMARWVAPFERARTQPATAPAATLPALGFGAVPR